MAEEIENIVEKLNWHWRNTMRPVRFLAFDARAAMPIPLLLVYFRWSTVILTILTMLLFRYLERKGLTFPAAMRSLRAQFAGKERPGWPGSFNKKFSDFG